MRKPPKFREIEDSLQAIRGVLQGCSFRELRRMKVVIEGLNDSNCWWYTYWAKELLVRSVIDERQSRKPQPSKAKVP